MPSEFLIAKPIPLAGSIIVEAPTPWIVRFVLASIETFSTYVPAAILIVLPVVAASIAA